MAYSSDREGNGDLDIWVQHVTERQPVRLTRDPGDDDWPSFSPDGSQVAVPIRPRGGGIPHRRGRAGSEPRRIADQGCIAKFSPDGTPDRRT